MKDLVSVIVPNYNHEEYLPQRLASIFNQTYKNFEVILLDDNSTDNSQEILNKYKYSSQTSHCVYNNVNSGSPFVQWNKGIELAKGKYIWIAESDDYCDKNFLENLVEVHKRNPDVALIYSQSYRVNSLGEIRDIWPNYFTATNPEPFKKDFVMEGNIFIENFLIHKNVIPNVSSVLFKAEDLRRIVPLKVEPYLKYTADWFYYIQILCNSKVGFVAKPLNNFRYHNNSVISNANADSGWLMILKMELRTRGEMIKYLERSNPANLYKIKKESKVGENHLYYLIAKGNVNRGQKFGALKVIIYHPSVIRRMIKFLVFNKVKFYFSK